MHTEETIQRISQSRLQAAHRIADEYEKLGFPPTKKCNHPECPEGNLPQPIENFSVKTRKWSDGRVVRYPHGYCRKCAARLARERRALLLEEDEEEARKRERRWRENHKEKNPEEHREYQRIWTEAKRREAGVPARNWTRREVTDGTPDVDLPVTDKFIGWLKSKNVSELEKFLNLGNGTLYNYSLGGRETIPLGFADRIIMQVNDGKALEDFWPDV